MNIRIIYDYNLTKLSKQYDFIKNISFFKNNEIIIYHSYNYLVNDANNNSVNKLKLKLKNERVKYNIYIDIISESDNNNDIYPSEYKILIVNDEYLLNNNYLRREHYKDEPLRKLDDFIDYYFCLTKYSFKYVSKNVDKKKVFLMDGLINYIESPLKILDKKYIYYSIDNYSKNNNILMLETWIKYFLDRHEILIINLKYLREDITYYIKQLIGINIFEKNGLYYYKNMIFYFNNRYTNNFKDKIYASIIYNSYFDLIIELYDNIIKNNFIITCNNEISKELLQKNAIYFNEFTESEIKKMLETLFNLDEKYIEKSIKNNRKTLEKNIKSTNKLLNGFH